jgi:hypothetical protein
VGSGWLDAWLSEAASGSHHVQGEFYHARMVRPLHLWAAWLGMPAAMHAVAAAAVHNLQGLLPANLFRNPVQKEKENHQECARLKQGADTGEPKASPMY